MRRYTGWTIRLAAVGLLAASTGRAAEIKVAVVDM